MQLVYKYTNPNQLNKKYSKIKIITVLLLT